MNSELLEVIAERLTANRARFMLGICGVPGAGKSTLAGWLVEQWNSMHPGQAVLVPMDGYHYSNETLDRMSLLALKGVPESFDSMSFVSKLEDIRTRADDFHLCPRFDRSIEASIADAIEVTPEHKLVVSEGNYLLLDLDPWRRVREILDEVWYVDASEETILPRLLARHMEGGKTESAAMEKVQGTDLPNARLIAEGRCRAQRIV